MTDQWFSFDGESFGTHETEEEARVCAEEAMDMWSEMALDDGEWCELSVQVCYGRITHAVRVSSDPEIRTEDGEECELHDLVPVEEVEE